MSLRCKEITWFWSTLEDHLPGLSNLAEARKVRVVSRSRVRIEWVVRAGIHGNRCFGELCWKECCTSALNVELTRLVAVTECPAQPNPTMANQPDKPVCFHAAPPLHTHTHTATPVVAEPTAAASPLPADGDARSRCSQSINLARRLILISGTWRPRRWMG